MIELATMNVDASSVSVSDDPVLRRYRAALDELYGDRLERVVLFGSRARRAANSDADDDIVVFLKTMPDRWAEFHRFADLRLGVAVFGRIGRIRARSVARGLCLPGTCPVGSVLALAVLVTADQQG